MPRSNRPRRRPARAPELEPEELDLERARSGFARRESAPDGTWLVRPVTARNAAKIYTCPGCHRSVEPGTAHLVVWAEDSLFGPEAALRERRHWHGNCWSTRSYRYR
jgi:hypothetical protein